MSTNKGRPAEVAEPDRHHNRLLSAIAEGLGLVHGEVRALRDTLTENGVKLQGARYLPLPANPPTSGRITLVGSAVELLGWVLIETSGAGAVVLHIEDGDHDGTDDGATVPVSVLAHDTNAQRWPHGISFARGVSVSWPAGNAGQVAGVVLVR